MVLRFDDRFARIKMLALDVDGVLTDGSLIYSANGELLKTFNVKDGYGLKKIQENGIIIVVLTARQSDILTYRMNELGIKYVYQGVEDKLKVLEGLVEQFMLNWSDIAYIGDDLIDLPILKKVGVPACPADAVLEVLNFCLYVSKKDGGKGCVRDIADLILRNKQ